MFGYKYTARVSDVRTLIHYFVTASMNEWEGFQPWIRCSSDLCIAVSFLYLFEKVSDVCYDIIKRLFNLIVSKCYRKTCRALQFPRLLLVMNSTTITIGKSRLPWAIYHRECSGVKRHVTDSPELEMPLETVETIVPSS